MTPEVSIPSSRPLRRGRGGVESAPVAFDQASGSDCRLVGSSAAFLATLEVTRRVAATGLPVLFVGETGTGKELFARYLHDVSRRAGDFVDVDCGTLPPDLADSLLFGHRKGAFTGAHESTAGFLEQADAGTLFLDELGSLEPATQRKLLRALELGEIRRVGGGKRRVTFQLVAAVQPDIRGQISAGDFRMDLMQRMAGAVVEIPSLAERQDDIVRIAHYYAKRTGVRLRGCAAELLRTTDWPGNVRELRLTVERAAALCRGEIDERAVEEAMGLGLNVLTRGVDTGSGRGFRRRELDAVCAEHGGKPDAVANALGVSRSTLYRRLADCGLDLKDYRVREAV